MRVYQRFNLHSSRRTGGHTVSKEIGFCSVMAMNVPYEAIGKGFVQQYYALFDDPAQRPNLINMYNVSAVITVDRSAMRLAALSVPARSPT